MKNKPQTLKGFRDFLPEEKRARDYVLAKIIEVFELYGFQPLETPTLEYASLLLGKYGEEADKLVYTFTDKGDRKVGLRYDQTVPTARVLSQYQNDLPKFFRRYQTQNVFRADKPQKGRYREFTQCDIDIFGSTNFISDIEILTCVYQAYSNIGFPNVKLLINDRKTLIQAFEPFAIKDVSVFSIIQSIDKLDKLSKEKVTDELISKGLRPETAAALLNSLGNLEPSPELQNIIDMASVAGIPQEAVVFQPTLARGLDYYTGMIFEVMSPDYKVGSLGAGGRYDNLVEDLSGLKMPAVGMAFGFDRTVEAATELGLVSDLATSAQVLVTVFDQKLAGKSLVTAQTLRRQGINTELYPSIDPIGKQFKFANTKNIPWVIVIGQEEADQGLVTLKNMDTGDQQQLSLEQVIQTLTK